MPSFPRPRTSTGLLALATVATLAFTGCSAAEPPPPVGDAGGSEVGCSTDPRAVPYTAGVTATSAKGSFVATIVSATPAPPRSGAGEANFNAWTMTFTTPAGQPLTAVPTLTTLMPDHGHGSPRAPVVERAADGTVTVKELYLFMGGLWEITFTVETAPGVTDAATFSFCVP